jgi:hypothetical protein
MKNLNDNLTPEQIELIKNYGIKQGMTIYTVLRHCSSSGMTRAIGLHAVAKDKTIIRLDYLAVQLGVGSFNKKHGGITVSGCGMDMGFDLVYRLSRKIFKRSKSHKNDGGYAIKQTWL